MAQIIGVLGNKGGTGKTTISHLLGHGFGLLGLRAVVAVTDTTREPLSRTGRRYLPADARRPEQLGRMAETLKRVEGWIGIVDGGGGRPECDDRLAALADLVLLPFRDLHEDLRTVRADLIRMPRAFGVPSQWPGNPHVREAALASVAALLGPHRERLLPPVMAMSASRLLLETHVPPRLPPELNAAARGLARHAALLLGLDVPVEGTPVARQREAA